MFKKFLANCLVVVRAIACWPFFEYLQDREWFAAGLVGLALVASDLLDGQSAVPKRYGVSTRWGERADVYVDRFALFAGLFGVYQSGMVVDWSSDHTLLGLLLAFLAASLVMADQSSSKHKGMYVGVTWAAAYAIIISTVLFQLSGVELVFMLVATPVILIMVGLVDARHVSWAVHGGDLEK